MITHNHRQPNLQQTHTRNRLTRAYTTTNTACGTANTGGPDPYDHTYSYAPDGKMLARDEGAGPVAYTYPTQGPGSVRPHAVSAIGTDTYTYDPNGQMTSRPGDTAQQTLGWNPEHQLVEITEGTDTNGFVYDADGTRLVRVTPDDTTIYFADHELIDTSTSTVEARRTYVMGSAAVGVRSDSGLDWLLGDMLGSMSLLVNAAAGTVTRRRYLPYGNQRGTIDWTSLDRGWIGQTHDQTTGLHYLNARYYDPTAGRFLSVDPFGLKSDSATWDGYGYSFANPVSSMDATGLWGEYGYDQWGAAVQAHLDVAMNPALSQPQSPSRSSRHALERAMDIAGIETEIISAFTAGFDRWNLEVWSLEVNQRRLFVFSDGNATAIFAASDRATLVVVQRVPTNLAAYASAIGNSVTAAGYVVTAASLMYAAYEGWEASEGQPLPDRVVASVDAAAPAAVQIGIDWGAFRVGSAACSAGGPIVSGLCGVGAIVSERAVIDLYNGERSHHSFCRGGVARVDEMNSMGFHHAPEQVQGCAG